MIMSKLVLFYSKKCKNCQNLGKLIQDNNLSEYFSFGCIDDPNVLKSLPPNVKSVPTIVNYATKEIFPGADSFKFINAVIAKRNQSQVDVSKIRPSMPNQPQPFGGMETGTNVGIPRQIQQNPPNQQPKKKEEDILPFSAEMCDGEECYSFLENANPIERNYFYIGDSPNSGQQPSTQNGRPQQQQQNPQFDLPSELQSKSIKKGKTDGNFDDLYTKYQNDRANTIPKPIARF